MMFQVTGLVKLSSISSRRTLLSQAFAGEVDPVGVVDYAIEDRVGQRRHAEHGRMTQSSNGSGASRSRNRDILFLVNSLQLYLSVLGAAPPLSLSSCQTDESVRSGSPLRILAKSPPLRTKRRLICLVSACAR